MSSFMQHQTKRDIQCELAKPGFANTLECNNKRASATVAFMMNATCKRSALQLGRNATMQLQCDSNDPGHLVSKLDAYKHPLWSGSIGSDLSLSSIRMDRSACADRIDVKSRLDIECDSNMECALRSHRSGYQIEGDRSNVDPIGEGTHKGGAQSRV